MSQAATVIEGFGGDVLSPGSDGYDEPADLERDARQAAGGHRAVRERRSDVGAAIR